jgi:outer membrane protein assembly factor BamE
MHKLLKLLFLLLLVGCAFLTGCGSAVPIVKPFKMDIQQGNVVTSKMLLQLKPGMTKSQVKFIMGTPLIVDSFHSNRWDYFYQMRQAGKIKEQRRVILEFENELLARVRGDVVPEGTAGAATGTEAGTVTLPKSVEPKAKEEGLLDKLKFWKKDGQKPEVKPEAKPVVEPEIKEIAPVPATNLETPANDAPSGDIPSGDVPSVLAVPIEIKPAQDVPAVEVNKIEAPAVEAPKIQPVKVEPIKPLAPLAVPNKPAPTVPAVTKPAATNGDPFSFRMDRNLDAKNLETPVEAEPAPKPKKVDVPPPPPEEDPGYFEKMLEKIGF